MSAKGSALRIKPLIFTTMSLAEEEAWEDYDFRFWKSLGFKYTFPVRAYSLPGS
jgi:hypothetical protein